MRKQERIQRNRFIKNRIIEIDVTMQKHPKLRNINFPVSCINDYEILLSKILLRKYGGKSELRGTGFNPYNMLTLRNPYCRKTQNYY